MKTILFICTGNICRSPMAEGWARHLVGDRKDIRVLSAGLGAFDGQPASAHAVEAMKQVGVDIRNHRSRRLTPSLVEQSDFIFGMTRGHVDSLIMMYPEAAERIFLLREFDDSASFELKDISDPIGMPMSAYVATRVSIMAAMPSVLQFVDQMVTGVTTAPSPEPTPEPKIRLSLGADHAGYELKNAIKQQLQTAGYECFDFGTNSGESCDYPDYAQAAAKEVADGRCTFGILVCKTGIGISMAANKVPGIRAALVRNEEHARLCRQHNNANIICLGSMDVTPEAAKTIINVFLTTKFEGGRHQRRVSKIEPPAVTNTGYTSFTQFDPEPVQSAPAKPVSNMNSLKNSDPEVYNAIRKELQRQQENIELIASENFTSPAILECQGSVLTNKYAEGYPGKRYYGGCEYVDVAEALAIERAKKLFGAEHANVQPHSGSQANMAVYFSVLQHGDKILTMELAHGGHLTHGSPRNFSGKFYNVTHYGVSQQTEQIDYDALAKQAKEVQPKLITAGASAYPRIIDYKKLREIADSVGALLFVDMAHIAGLVAAGLHPSPVPYADFVTTTTHKTLRGPRAGLILCKAKFAKDVDTWVLPGIQGGPLMHVIAAKAVCFQEAMQPAFKEYQKQIVANAKTLASALAAKGLRIVSGGTDTHLMLVDLRSRKITGKIAQEALDKAGITVNKNLIPFDPEKPLVTSGIRVGSPAVTTRGMKEAEMQLIADYIDEVLRSPADAAVADAVRAKVRALTGRFPLPYAME